MNVVAVADTHIKSTGIRRLPHPAYALLERADLILHAGDVVVAGVLEDLARFAPVMGVLGNNDRELAGVLPPEQRFDLDGLRTGMIHDSGPAPGRERRMKKRFADCALVVFGHSHIPLVATGLDGQVLLNPGSPTDKRRQPNFTMATFEVSDGRLAWPRIRIVG